MTQYSACYGSPEYQLAAETFTGIACGYSAKTDNTAHSDAILSAMIPARTGESQ